MTITKLMQRLLRDLERIIDTLIWPALIVLLVIILIEIGFSDTAHHYHAQIVAADAIIILLFVVDLCFKWARTRKIKPFLKRYWLDILAVFPFFLIFRAFEGISILFGSALEIGENTQKIIHESLELEKEGSKVLREAEIIGKESTKLSRTTRFQRFLRPVFRTPRFLKAANFFEKP